MWIEKNRIKPENNIVVAQAWISKDSRRSPTKFRSFKVILKYLKLYCQYSCLTSFKYLIDPKKTWYERILWITIHCITISSLIFMVCTSYKEFRTSPLLTSIDTDNYRTTDLNFPAIAICSINRISRQSAIELATNISKTVTDLPLDEILDLVKQLGNHYASEFSMDENRNVEIDQLFKTYYNGSFDLTEILKRLSPPCSTMLLQCKLHGTSRNCSQLFEFRKTQDGFCCTFNYARESDDIPVMGVSKPIRIHKVDDLGIERGLTVVLEPFLEDYFYSILPVVGWKVIVFNPTDFPDVTSGGVTEVLAAPRTETYVDVTTTSFFSTKNIEGFPAEYRNCLFPKEVHTMSSGNMYSYSDCIVDCKIHDIQQLCGCRPFNYPCRGKKEFSWRICTNTDLECMSKYKSKWWTVFPHEIGITEKMLPNKDWALHCHNCYPTCEDVNYDVLSAKSYISPGEYKTHLLWDFNITNQGIVHVFFSKYGTIRLKQDVASHWYELLSYIGGICGVFIGFSFISIVELLYFFALMLRELLFNKSDLQEDDEEDHEENHEEEIQSSKAQTIQTIYWNELLPRTWQSVKYGQYHTSHNNRLKY